MIIVCSVIPHCLRDEEVRNQNNCLWRFCIQQVELPSSSIFGRTRVIADTFHLVCYYSLSGLTHSCSMS